MINSDFGYKSPFVASAEARTNGTEPPQDREL